MQLCIETPVLAIPQAMLDGWQAEGFMELLGQVSEMAALFAIVDMVVLPSVGAPAGFGGQRAGDSGV